MNGNDIYTPLQLTVDELNTVLQAERILHDLLPQLDHLEKCGRDCELLREQLQVTQEQIQSLRTHFAPPISGEQLSGYIAAPAQVEPVAESGWKEKREIVKKLTRTHKG